VAWLARRYPAPRNGATSKGDRRILGDGAGRTTRWSVGLAASLLRLVTAGCRPGFGGSPNSGRGRDGNAGGTPTDSSRRYDPATDACTATRLVGAPAARPLDTAVWSGTQRIACGGFGGGHRAQHRTPRHTPSTASTDRWSATGGARAAPGLPGCSATKNAVGRRPRHRGGEKRPPGALPWAPGEAVASTPTKRSPTGFRCVRCPAG
jgi:hypothetical protein